MQQIAVTNCFPHLVWVSDFSSFHFRSVLMARQASRLPLEISHQTATCNCLCLVQCYSLDLLPAATNLDADTEETLGGLSWGYSSYDYFNDSYAGSVSISHHLAIFSHTNSKKSLSQEAHRDSGLISPDIRHKGTISYACN